MKASRQTSLQHYEHECRMWTTFTRLKIFLNKSIHNKGCKIRTRRNESKIDIVQAAFNKKETLFTNKLELNSKEQLVNSYFWCVAIYGAEIWTRLELYQKYLEFFYMCCCRKMEKISWTDRVRTEVMLLIVKMDRSILNTIKRRKVN
jgi:hypothetical protein